MTKKGNLYIHTIKISQIGVYNFNINMHLFSTNLSSLDRNIPFKKKSNSVININI